MADQSQQRSSGPVSASPHAPVQPATQRHAGWVLCRFAGICLALRQADVRSIEPVLSVMPAHAAQSQAAWFRRGEALWPVYRLDGSLALSSTNAAERFAVFVETLHRPTGILVEQASMLGADRDLTPQALPACMSSPDSPIEQLAMLGENDIALVVQAQGLGCYLEGQAAAREAAA